MRDILLMQKRELEKSLSEPYVQRQYKKTGLDNDLIKVVLGPRRAGKSFFSMRLAQSWGPFGYVNFDDERLVGIENYDQIITAVNSIYEYPKVLLLDEIQNLPKWELFVNRLQRQGLRLIVTGSNAHLLSSELATHLTGRHIPIILFPFSYDEYLRWHNKEMTTVEMAEQLHVYAQSGGFPEPIVKSVSRQDYLTTLLHSILYKDIVSRYGIRAVQGLENLATYLIANAAQEYSLKTLSTVSHCKSVHTVEKFLLYLERAFLFFHIQRFSYKIRQQLRSPRKIYCIDNGWVTSSSFRISADRGKLWENLVAIALKKRSLSENVEVFFWKSARGEEVDFVVKKGLIIEQLIQVCCDPSHPKTREREIRALLKASAELHCDDLMVLTENEETQEQVSWYGHSGLVRFVPLWKWLTVK